MEYKDGLHTTEKVGWRLPPELAKWIREEARSRGLSASKFAEWAFNKIRENVEGERA